MKLSKFMKKIALILVVCLSINIGGWTPSIVEAITSNNIDTTEMSDTILNELQPDEELQQTKPSDSDIVEGEGVADDLSNEDTGVSTETESTEEVKETEEVIEEDNESEVEEVSDQDTPVSLREDGRIIPAIAAEEEKTTTSGKNPLTLTKTATQDENNPEEYEISLDITGTAQQQQVKTADIVIVMDKSGSMTENGSQKLSLAKKGAIKFVENLLGTSGTTPSNIGISVVQFDSLATRITGIEDKPFIKDSNILKSKINGIQAGDGTNTEAGINKAKQLLDKSEANQKYVVLFTDGLPTFYCKGEYIYGYQWKRGQNNSKYMNGNGSDTTKECRNAAISAYKKVIADSSVTFYSAGVFDRGSSSNTAREFLGNVQNVTIKYPEIYGTGQAAINKYLDGYKKGDKTVNKHYTSNENDIENMFEDMSIEIQNEINKLIAKNVTVTDTVTKYFELIDGSKYTITDYKSDKLEINKDIVCKVEASKVDTEYGGTTVKEDKLTFKINEIREPGISIKFKVKVKDSYFFGNDVPTNTTANIEFNDPLDTSENPNVETGEFPVPSVDIEPKIGTINVTKVITEGADKAPENDTFSVLIKGESAQYNIDVQAGNDKTKSMSFIMKGDNTDITDSYITNYIKNNNLQGYNFVKAGTYNVSEIVPMNYTKVGTVINNKNTETFELSKDNRDINIVVKNKLVNEIYFFDKFTKPNIFKLLKIS
ncbi:VWA domain-containing protein [Romboutsia weinsteinii]|uniref:VWA domain-containing protein n=1 Tax=Romboutsia weinsteinii TaxID=2020949 RepID=A0A371J3V2_9FIRM|nr:VWA domain-containing protein [Romboutsia weinsteinii]RDY27415.1 VWA domain-containing protein [Romboutsia weinsteinii]